MWVWVPMSDIRCEFGYNNKVNNDWLCGYRILGTRASEIRLWWNGELVSFVVNWKLMQYGYRLNNQLKPIMTCLYICGFLVPHCETVDPSCHLVYRCIPRDTS